MMRWIKSHKLEFENLQKKFNDLENWKETSIASAFSLKDQKKLCSELGLLMEENKKYKKQFKEYQQELDYCK